jgi:hypothetical protein
MLEKVGITNIIFAYSPLDIHEASFSETTPIDGDSESEV